MTFWALLFLILILSALVAYLGDRVAKWAGKRHFRLFGLRPRQTATLVAVLTGVGIALFSYLGFLLVFREAREVILQAEAIRAERDTLRAERDTLLEAKAAMEAEAARALAELNRLREERRTLAEALEGAEARWEALQGERKRLESELESLKAELGSLEAEKAAFRALLARRGQELRRLEAEVRRLKEERDRLSAERKALEEELMGNREGLLLLRREREALAQEVEALKGALARSRAELRQAEERVRQLLVQAGVLQGSRDQLSQSLVRLSQGLYLGEVRLGSEEGTEALRRAVERRAILLGYRGAELLGEAQGPGLAVLEGAGYREGRLLVRFRFYPEKKAFSRGEVLSSATFRLSTPLGNREVLERLGREAQNKLLQAGFPPEYADFPTPEALAQGLSLLEERRGVARVGVVALGDLWTTERPLLTYRLLGGPPGPEVPIPTRQIP
ncbi:hypothetical protein GCM10007092_09960 [Thermus composti]|uniref:DUF3084 domain-containing protein n=1 Tax=Thermus composti TaxID=532059 RepID=A0ABV6Q1J3_9DEIN|nr:DUF3084 domain-containing protein [Thermus composti]GGM98194.1 hypothetical protein GCM10007092_09960 [Thermus composti]